MDKLLKEIRLLYKYIFFNVKISLVYRSQAILDLFTKLLILFIQISIWMSITSVQNSSFTLDLLVRYSIISMALSLTFDNNIIFITSYRIYSGVIAYDLVQPIQFKLRYFLVNTGKIISTYIFQLIPIIFIASFFVELKFPGIIFFISVINAVLLSFYLNYVLGLLAFWHTTIWHLDRLLKYLIKLLSGAWVPLWFYPEFFAEVINFLPFKYIYFFPISIYLEKISNKELVNGFIFQVSWLLILIFLEKIVWSKCLNKLSIQGG